MKLWRLAVCYDCFQFWGWCLLAPFWPECRRACVENITLYLFLYRSRENCSLMVVQGLYLSFASGANICEDLYLKILNLSYWSLVAVSW